MRIRRLCPQRADPGLAGSPPARRRPGLQRAPDGLRRLVPGPPMPGRVGRVPVRAVLLPGQRPGQRTAAQSQTPRLLVRMPGPLVRVVLGPVPRPMVAWHSLALVSRTLAGMTRRGPPPAGACRRRARGRGAPGRRTPGRRTLAGRTLGRQVLGRQVLGRCPGIGKLICPATRLAQARRVDRAGTPRPNAPAAVSGSLPVMAGPWAGIGPRTRAPGRTGGIRPMCPRVPDRTCRAAVLGPGRLGVGGPPSHQAGL